MSGGGFLDGVSGTGQQAPAERELNAQGSGADGIENLDTQDFVKILTTQLQNQSPKDPMKQKEMIGQITQLTNLEQTQKMSEQIGKITKSSRNSQYISILGADVNVQTKGGDNLSGKLSKVKFEGGNTNIKVGERTIPANKVKSIGVDGA